MDHIHSTLSATSLRSLDRLVLFVPWVRTTLAQTRSFATIGMPSLPFFPLEWPPFLSSLDLAVWISSAIDFWEGRFSGHLITVAHTTSFATIGPSLWNTLPSSFRLTLLSGSLLASLSLLKTYFYSQGLRTGSVIEWYLPWAAFYNSRNTRRSANSQSLRHISEVMSSIRFPWKN